MSQSGVQGKTKVLVVDDSPSAVQEVSDALLAHGFEVFTAFDGDAAFEVIENTPGLNLLISDLNMPNLDGIGLAKRIFNSGFAYKFPIVILSTEFSSDLKLEGKKFGVKLWIVKPFHKKDFGEMMVKLCEGFSLQKSLPLSEV